MHKVADSYMDSPDAGEGRAASGVEADAVVRFLLRLAGEGGGGGVGEGDWETGVEVFGDGDGVGFKGEETEVKR